MALYESVFIARQDISAAQVETLAGQFAEIITKDGGEVKKTEMWGLKTLAYKIKKNRKGHYVLFNIDAPAPAIVEMERNMGLNEDVLRFMTVRVDKLEEGPSAMLQNKGGDRGDRNDRGPRPDRGGDRGYRPRRESSEGDEA